MDELARAALKVGDVSDLTPYDTGAVLEPHVWSVPDDPASGDWGKVDFDNDEGGTDLTLRVIRDPRNDDTLIVEVGESNHAVMMVVTPR